MPPIRLAPALAVLLLAGAAPSLARDKPIPTATPAGDAVDCIHVATIDHTRVRSDSVIDFYMRGGKVYRNMLPAGGCARLGFEERFSYTLSTSQLCSVDIIRVLTSDGGRLSEGAGCGLGKFQPVTLASR